MQPISSASAMKVAGGTMPLSGWRQRISASKPLTSPLSRLTTGW